MKPMKILPLQYRISLKELSGPFESGRQSEDKLTKQHRISPIPSQNSQ